MARKFKVATWNVNSIRARIEHVTRWLSEKSPDVLCMQETKETDDKFPVEPFEETGYHVVFRGQKSYNGVAIASREEAQEVSCGLDVGREKDEPRLIRVKIAGIDIVNTYVPQGRDIESEHYAYKLKWFGRLKRFFTKHFTPEKDLIWVGDLNVAPTPLDVHNPERQAGHVCYHEDARKAMQKVVDWGFIDVFRKHRPEAGQFSFFDYRASSFKNNKGWRVDHILATETLAGRSSGAGIDLEPRKAQKPSDHTVMFAEFEI